jgi:hypothetical protein
LKVGWLGFGWGGRMVLGALSGVDMFEVLIVKNEFIA